MLTYARDDAALRRRGRPAKRGSSCRCRSLTPVAVRALGRAGHPGARRASPGRWSSRCATRSSAREHDIAAYVPDPPGGLLGLRPGGRAGAHAVREARRRDPLVVGLDAGRPERPAADRPGLGRRVACTSTSATAWSTRHPQALWRVIEGIGGERGWYSFPLAWAVRGLARPAVGGVGLRRGRRDPRPPARSASRSTSGGSRTSSRASCCGCAPRCGCRAWPGSSCRSARTPRADDLPPAGALPPARAGRPRLLVVGRAVPRRRLRRHAHEHRRRRRAGRTGGRHALSRSRAEDDAHRLSRITIVSGYLVSQVNRYPSPVFGNMEIFAEIKLFLAPRISLLDRANTLVRAIHYHVHCPQVPQFVHHVIRVSNKEWTPPPGVLSTFSNSYLVTMPWRATCRARISARWRDNSCSCMFWRDSS